MESVSVDQLGSYTSSSESQVSLPAKNFFLFSLFLTCEGLASVVESDLSSHFQFSWFPTITCNVSL